MNQVLQYIFILTFSHLVVIILVCLIILEGCHQTVKPADVTCNDVGHLKLPSIKGWSAWSCKALRTPHQNGNAKMATHSDVISLIIHAWD